MKTATIHNRVEKVEKMLGLKGDVRILFPPEGYQDWTEADQEAWERGQGVKPIDTVRIIILTEKQHNF